MNTQYYKVLNIIEIFNSYRIYEIDNITLYDQVNDGLINIGEKRLVKAYIGDNGLVIPKKSKNEKVIVTNCWVRCDNELFLDHIYYGVLNSIPTLEEFDTQEFPIFIMEGDIDE